MLLSCAAISLLLAAAAPAEVAVAPVEMPRARDGNIAIQEELEAARRAASVEAYDLFIARHPDHPLAKVAREERQCLIDRRKEDKR